MSISDRERQILESIESDLAITGPKLASMLVAFARLTAGEDMSMREKLRRAFDVPPATGRLAGAQTAARTSWWRRTLPRLRTHSAWVICLVVAMGLIALALAVDHSTGQGVCPVAGTAACRELYGPGGTVHGGR